MKYLMQDSALNYLVQYPPAGSYGSRCGAEGIRTLDLSDANRTLSQLSYSPVAYL